MRIYYESGSGQILDLMSWPYKIKSSNILGYEWTFTETENTGIKSGGTISAIRKKIERSEMIISIFAMSKQGYNEAVNNFLAVTERDILNETPGRLWVDDYFYTCYIYGSEKLHWERMTTYLDNTLKIVSPYPFWCKEETKAFLPNASSEAVVVDDGEMEEAKAYLSYPYAYPYRYSTPSDISALQNDHYAACDFKMIIYGPCENPAVRIAGHLYEVIVTLYEGEYLVIDSRNNTVIRYSGTGETKSFFNQRNKDNELFEKIPAGRSTVIWNKAAFGFDLVLFQERSEPLWSL